ncbi:MAG TPA: protein-L-isoaspartate(D-aspartate) O-methyltransferase [Candidatus Limnocylindria bacterium]|nr:protein-L-isoaspartate(D-aspartate) O-methyltransferase [Candidatus Limnocylindria bacterium]
MAADPHDADAGARRARMVREQIEARGIRDAAVLDAMRRVPREAFVPPELAEFAYTDSPLPIEEGQTISQPYIVALMTAALELRPDERVLEIGTGSGYAAAVLACVAREVYSVERHGPLAELARRRLADLGFHNVWVLHGDGTFGWAEHAPYDAIVVAAGGPSVPPALLEQLAPGGRLVIPVGEHRAMQQLVRIRRLPSGELRQENLGGVRFVPLVGAAGWEEEETAGQPPRGSRPETVARLLREVGEPIDLGDVELGPLLERIGGARLVLLGEATHGTSEFYALRAAITRALVRRGFAIVAVEADWPDAARAHAWVRGRMPERERLRWMPFARFPTWMWRNHEVGAFLDWLREWNARPGAERPAGFYGLDLYSLYTSIRVVLDYLDRVDPATARIARERYGCLTPWEGHPAVYGQAAVTGRYRVCEKEAVAMLRDLLKREVEYAAADGEAFLDTVQNARLIADAERYYRVMYYGGEAAWNLRDRHMFETLQALLRFHGPDSRAVVWAHNSHLGNARATEMSVRGELNLGQLCREAYGDAAYLVGFGTDHGTVAAAHDWDGPMEVMHVRPAHPASYEHLCHLAERPAFFLPLREAARPEVRDEFMAARLERAIGVVYRPDTELQSHYFHAVLPHQFDEWIWIDETRAVHPVSEREALRLPLAHPFSGHGHA